METQNFTPRILILTSSYQHSFSTYTELFFIPLKSMQLSQLFAALTQDQLTFFRLIRPNNRSCNYDYIKLQTAHTNHEKITIIVGEF